MPYSYVFYWQHEGHKPNAVQLISDVETYSENL